MTDGLFQFFGEDGALWADESMIMHFCRKTGSATTITKTSPTSSSRAVIPIAGYIQPVVAIVMSGGYAAARDRDQTLSGVLNANFATDAPVGTSFLYYIFDYAPAMTPGGMIQGYNESGQLTFDSNYWAMKGVKFMTQFVGADPEEYSMTGRQLAICCGTVGGHYFITYADCRPVGELPDPDRPMEGCPRVYTEIDSKLYGGKITNSGQTATSVQVSYSDTTGFIGDEAAYNSFITNGNGWNIPSKIMVVDVTGIPANTTFF